MLVRTETFRKAQAGITAPNDAAAATEYSNSTGAASFTDIQPTVNAATELLVVVAGGIRDATAITSITLSSDVDGALTAKIDPPDPGAGRTFAGVWYLQSPTSGAHTITLTKNGGGDLTCFWAVVLQLKDVNATPFETDSDYTATDATASATPLTLNGSITTENDNSLVIAFACVEDPTEAGPFTAYNEGLSVVHEGQTGTSTANVDHFYGVASKVQATAGAAAWEIVTTQTEDWAAGAVAVRGAA